MQSVASGLRYVATTVLVGNRLKKGSLHTVETCWQHGASFCHVHGFRNQYKAEVARQTQRTSENLVPTEVANVVDSVATLSPDVFERERCSFLECFNNNSTRASERFLCNCCSYAWQSSTNLGYFQESRVKAHKTVANHEDDFVLGGPSTNFGARSPSELGRMAGSYGSDAATSFARSPHIYPIASLSSTIAGNACDSSPGFALIVSFRHSFIDLEVSLLVTHSVVVAPISRTAESGRVSTQHSHHQTFYCLQ